MMVGQFIAQKKEEKKELAAREREAERLAKIEKKLKLRRGDVGKLSKEDQEFLAAAKAQKKMREDIAADQRRKAKLEADLKRAQEARDKVGKDQLKELQQVRKDLAALLAMK